jgi:acetyl-CoA synthetase
MRDTLIRKTNADLRVAPNLPEGGQAAFDWSEVRAELVGPRGDCNLARLCVDRHAQGARSRRVALRFLKPDAAPQELTYADLKRLSSRFANGLRALGIGNGDHVFVLAGRSAPLYVAVLGGLRNGSVVTPLFSAFGPEPIATRIRIARARVLVTTEALYLRKIEKIRESLPTLQHVIVVGEGGTTCTLPDTLDYSIFLSSASETFPDAPTPEGQLALLAEFAMPDGVDTEVTARIEALMGSFRWAV